MLQKINSDITKLPFRVDAIVNSAHPSLMPGGGVCGAIYEAAGEGLEEECMAHVVNHTIGKIIPSEAIATTPHNLKEKCDWIIHVNPPQNIDNYYNDKNALLEDSYKNSLYLAERLGCKSIAFPLLGAGIYGWDEKTALKIAEEVLGQSKLDVTLVLFK